jgi:hypothetical protein
LEKKIHLDLAKSDSLREKKKKKVESDLISLNFSMATQKLTNSFSQPKKETLTNIEKYKIKINERYLVDKNP